LEGQGSSSPVAATIAKSTRGWTVKWFMATCCPVTYETFWMSDIRKSSLNNRKTKSFYRKIKNHSANSRNHKRKSVILRGNSMSMRLKTPLSISQEAIFNRETPNFIADAPVYNAFHVYLHRTHRAKRPPFLRKEAVSTPLAQQHRDNLQLSAVQFH
jgi:hypothetical protein